MSLWWSFVQVISLNDYASNSYWYGRLVALDGKIFPTWHVTIWQKNLEGGSPLGHYQMLLVTFYFSAAQLCNSFGTNLLVCSEFVLVCWFRFYIFVFKSLVRWKIKSCGNVLFMGFCGLCGTVVRKECPHLQGCFITS